MTKLRSSTHRRRQLFGKANLKHQAARGKRELAGVGAGAVVTWESGKSKPRGRGRL
jgi:hypothetical protein